MPAALLASSRSLVSILNSVPVQVKAELGMTRGEAKW